MYSAWYFCCTANYYNASCVFCVIRHRIYLNAYVYECDVHAVFFDYHNLDLTFYLNTTGMWYVSRNFTNMNIEDDSVCIEGVMDLRGKQSGQISMKEDGSWPMVMVQGSAMYE